MAAKHGRTPLRVFVYKNDVPCIATRTSGARTRFESHLAQLFATGWHRTDVPEKADIFYHPACLVERFWRNREGLRQIDERVPSRSYVSDLRAGRTLSTRCGALAYGSTEIASKRTTRGTAWERMRCLRCGRSRHKSGASRGPTRDSIAPCFDSAYKRPSHWTEDGQRTFRIATIVPPAHRCDRPAVGRSACSSSAQ